VGTVNADPAVRGLLKVLFIPNYNVTLAEHRARHRHLRTNLNGGDGGFRHRQHELAINGALTVGTLDGANVKFRTCGQDFIFGLMQPSTGSAKGEPCSRDIVDHSPHLNGHWIDPHRYFAFETTRYHG
jgi:starch phosphorylase